MFTRHGTELLHLIEGKEGSISSGGDVISGPLQLAYDEHGDLVFPGDTTGSRPWTDRSER